MNASQIRNLRLEEKRKLVVEQLDKFVDMAEDVLIAVHGEDAVQQEVEAARECIKQLASPV